LRCGTPSNLATLLSGRKIAAKLGIPAGSVFSVMSAAKNAATSKKPKRKSRQYALHKGCVRTFPLETF
jgi:hypothetical protein